MESTKNKLKHIHIMHLSPFPYYSGGIDTWLLNFLNTLDPKYQVTLYCRSPKQDMKIIHDISKFNNLNVIYLGQFKNIPTRVIWAFKVCKKLFSTFQNDEKIIVLSTPTMLPIILLRILGRIKGEITLSVRGQISKDAVEMGKSFLFQKIVRFAEGCCMRAADKIVANGWDTQRFIFEYFNLPSEVIPNGYLPKKLDLSPKDKIDLQMLEELKVAGKILFIHIGTVRRLKCIDMILKAISLLSDDNKVRFAMVFIGKGMIDYYSQLAEKLDVKATFLGEKTDVAPYNELADFVINVSGGSGVSNSLIETLSAGKPVITWNNVTFTQVVKEDVNGILCNHRDEQALSLGFEKAIKMHNQFDSKAIKETAKPFQWQKIEEIWLRHLND